MTEIQIEAEHILAALRERHKSNGKRDCGARTREMPCQWTKGSTHIRHCTEDPGHKGDHKDALHCWSFETFTDDDVVEHSPRNLACCDTCNQPWPCAEREFLNDLVRTMQGQQA